MQYGDRRAGSYTSCSVTVVVRTVKLNRLRWAGHIIRMEENHVPRRILKDKLGTGRRVGRPKTTQMVGWCIQ